ncbi:AI-2E family transporter [Pyxidicoccus fallax]|uniref:AI-2E family transporter n=1 Tax=Pyxidicoccus fallax TaxID=394095 RepID=A0A848LAQ3_9BACT|nr:AI-2E family transporter [Pyxidicoccus fallax]NMO16140.1 AI-2E family transporter [Pyxidicoccus fallax]NPC83197.1 AI-2E family transporter [Pyxidicoccus fallax]
MGAAPGPRARWGRAPPSTSRCRVRSPPAPCPPEGWESNVLQPLVMGRVLPLHPAVLLLAVTAGAMAWGIAGAFVAVPLLAMVTAGTQAFLAEGRKLRPREREQPAEPPGLEPGRHLEH